MSRPITHGESNNRLTAEYSAWKRMRSRCLFPFATGYQYYGGRGIKICERWDSYENFLSDMRRRPSTGHSLDRIDNEGDYTPENCRWATPGEQGNNKRNTHRITFQEETKTITQWAKILGMNDAVLRNRIANLKWSIERAFTQPVRNRRTRAQDGTLQCASPQI